MKKTLLPLTAFVAGAASAAMNLDGVVTADRMAASALTGEFAATGNVSVVTGPIRLTAPWARVSTDGPWVKASLPESACVTTCTNAPGHLHWCATGSVDCKLLRDRKDHPDAGPEELVLRDATLRLFDIPIGWAPYAWIPRHTDYGWRVMPGYTSRWGAYLLTKYVYPIAGDMSEGSWGLRGSSRFDLRTKNGVAVGQGVGWSLGDFGQGKFKVYYAWDQDADRYDRRWNSSRHSHYGNWGSTVPDERYGLSLTHRWEPSERDIVRLSAGYFSDSHFRSDLLRNNALTLANRYPTATRNELAWEHAGLAYAFGASVSGPLNDFYGGVSRLPEVYLDLAPQPVFSLPVNYESQSRFGWLNRDYAKHGRSSTALPYRYDPGIWADYQAVRGDTYHRLSVPFKVDDLVSVVPRVGVRGTWWSDSGRQTLEGDRRARALDEDVTRSIVEGGVTFAARGTAPFGERWQHVVEPYADVLAQEAHYSGLTRNARPFIFDSNDASADWLDQFAGRSRNLPYSWYGVTPGLRNAFRKADESGTLRTIFDVDAYVAVQFNDTDWTEGGRYHRQTRDPKRPNYGRDGKAMAAPGIRARWFATSDATLFSRAEWDGENDTLAYADVTWQHRLSKSFKYELSYTARDQRWWDYSSTPYDPEQMRNEDFNWVKYDYAQLSFEHELCDLFAWGPFISWDLRENELDEIGTWFDIRPTDCLAFRLSFSYENDYRRIDDSERRDNWRCSFMVYLRALGPKAASLFAE